MRFLDRLRAKSNAKRETKALSHHADTETPSTFYASRTNFEISATLLADIFSVVCPHSRDGAYVSSEDSMKDGECPLCDLEDLAHCGLVNRQWNKCANELLYQNVRIDAIHFCGRPFTTSKKRSSFNVSVHGNDPARQRLALFVTTIRRNRKLALSVRTLKIPYMTREAASADIARAVAAPLSNLRFLDLPEGICRDDSSMAVLKAELETNCPSLRWWKVAAGGEYYLTRFEEGLWPRLEELTLSDGLLAGSQQVARIIVTFPAITKVSLLNLPNIDDGLFAESACLPGLRELSIQGTPNLTARGLIAYPRLGVGQALRILTLAETAIEVPQLPQILASFSSLEVLHMTLTVKRPFPLTNVSLLSSTTLRELKYEISTSIRSSNVLASPVESYYKHLAASILGGTLPSLVHLFALSVHFPDMLLGAVPNRKDMDSQLTWLRQTLHVYTKSDADLEWDLTIINPRNDLASAQRSTRPLSVYNSQPSTPFGRDPGRKSIMVGNGFGGFLMVPEQEDPLTPGRKSPMGKRKDEWWAS